MPETDIPHIGGIVGVAYEEAANGNMGLMEALGGGIMSINSLFTAVGGDPDAALVDEWIKSDARKNGVSFSKYKQTKRIISQNSFGFIDGFYTVIVGKVYQVNINGQKIQLNGKISVADFQNMLDGDSPDDPPGSKNNPYSGDNLLLLRINIIKLVIKRIFMLMPAL